MIRVSVEVYSEETRLRAAVLARSIERAVSLVRARYPDGEARVIFPIEADTFFVEGVVRTSDLVSLETPEEVVG